MCSVSHNNYSRWAASAGITHHHAHTLLMARDVLTNSQAMAQYKNTNGAFQYSGGKLSRECSVKGENPRSLYGRGEEKTRLDDGERERERRKPICTCSVRTSTMTLKQAHTQSSQLLQAGRICRQWNSSAYSYWPHRQIGRHGAGYHFHTHML